VNRYLARLEAQISAHPADAVAHLLWNCYGPATDPAHALDKRRKRSRRRSLAAATTVAPARLEGAAER
jgi:hypothetical protein